LAKLNHYQKSRDLKWRGQLEYREAK